MANKTGIEWTDASSNPIRYRDKATGKDVWACVKYSPGCARCYAESIALRFKKGGPFTKAQMEKVEPYVSDEELGRLLRSKKLAGQRVFLGDMTDVFGEWVSDEQLDRLFAVMALRGDVTFQVLTKRADRMRTYVERLSRSIDPLESAARDMGYTFEFRGLGLLPWPIPNVWLGTSVEDQQRADERIPELLKVPAAVRFLSVEPLLSAVNLDNALLPSLGELRGLLRIDWKAAPKVDWLIVGGESGPHARPCNVEWVRSIVRQCRDTGTACFVKQLGRKPCGYANNDETATIRSFNPLQLADRKGASMEEWPDDLRVRQFPNTNSEG